MKTLILSGWLALALATLTLAIDAPPPAGPPTAQDAQDFAEQLRSATEKIADLQNRLDTVEKRLGESYRAVSPFDTVERRLDDIEKDIDSLKRR